MIEGGYILQPRCIDKSEASNFPPVTRELWLYLLRKVNHKDNGKYKRGQGFFNFGDIQKDLSWFVGYRRETYSKPQLTKSLRRLCDARMVETMKETRGLLITVLNYAIYQDPSNYEGNGEGLTKEMACFKGGDTKNKNEKNEKNLFIKPAFISEKNWKDLLEHRKSKKAANTERALTSLIREIKTAIDMKYTDDQCIDEITSRNWTGFKADWLVNAKVQPYNDGF